MATAKKIKINGIEYDVGGGEAPSLLWKNESPSSSFGAQTITLSDDVSNYDYLGIICAQGSGATGRTRILPMIFYPIGSGLNAYMAIGTYRNYIRAFSSISGNSIKVGEGAYYASYGASATTTDNSSLIPRYIIGFKCGGNISTQLLEEEE